MHNLNLKPKMSSNVSSSRNQKLRSILIATTSIFIFIVSIALLIKSSSNQIIKTPSVAIQKTCSLTRHQDLCLNSLLHFPNANQSQLVHISLNVTLHRITHALSDAFSMSTADMDPRARSAYEDCLELLDDSIHQISQSLSILGGPTSAQEAHEDILTWLSAALTNQDTCHDALSGVTDDFIKRHLLKCLKDLSALVSNSLAIFASHAKHQNLNKPKLNSDFPYWVKDSDRRLLEISTKADIVVSKDGNGDFTSITDAVKHAPEYSKRRFVIYVKAGRYDENVKVGLRKTNLMFVGDGRGETIVAGCRSVFDNFTTFHTATFAATGAGFMMRDMTIENWAGPEKHQAVALRVGADHSVVYRCNVIGYQDTLYVHSQRQFYRECDVFGTVDFIFGNAAVVFQDCNIWARKPMPHQKVTITAQNRKHPNQNTGISIHSCRILAMEDMMKTDWEEYPTFLGRPWKMYSRVVYMTSYVGPHVHKAGWLEWNDTFGLDTLYYGEYMNYGPGAAVGKRVTWPGYKVITEREEAGRFTVGEFIYGLSWLPFTGVQFLAGLYL